MSRDENVEIDCGKTRKHRIRNVHIQENLGITSIDDEDIRALEYGVYQKS